MNNYPATEYVSETKQRKLEVFDCQTCPNKKIEEQLYTALEHIKSLQHEKVLLKERNSKLTDLLGQARVRLKIIREDNEFLRRCLRSIEKTENRGRTETSAPTGGGDGDA